MHLSYFLLNFEAFEVFLEKKYYKYRWTSLYARDRDFKNMLEYNEFAYKKTTYNKGRLYIITITTLINKVKNKHFGSGTMISRKTKTEKKLTPSLKKS